MMDSGSDDDAPAPDKDAAASADTELERDLQRPDNDDAFDRERSLKKVAASLLGTPEEASRIGPFFVLERLGAGGMGVVYAAYDPRLDRKVAIKLLQPADATRTDSGRVDEEARERLLREARALAKLTHPNVVTVHEVGLHDDEVYVAMAFIEGQTLREWIDDGPHSIDDILEVMTAAGFGLAAAHDAGIIHRDFKPQNVLMGDDKTVCVADFGLARDDENTDDEQPDNPRPVEVPRSSAETDPLASDPGSSDLTRTGSILGTPLYMAPEQHFSEPVSTATDQFAFALTLYETLAGEFPLEQDLLGLVQTKAKGKIPRPEKTASGERIPTWLADAIMRGLAPEPAKRHPDMHAFLTDLEPPRPGRQKFMIGAAVAIVTLAAVPLVLGGEREVAESPCVTVAAEFDSVWSPERAQTIQAAFEGSGVGYADSVWEALLPQLDDAAGRWKEARTQVCQLAVSGTETDAVVTRRLECLDRSKLRLEGTLDLFEEAAPDTVDRAGSILGAAPGVSGCLATRLSYSREWSPTDPEVLEQRKTAWEELAAVETLNWQGAYEEATERLDALAASRDVDIDPFVAAEYYSARSALDRDQRQAMTHKALAAAVRSGSDRMMISRYVDLGNVSIGDSRPADAKLAVSLGLAVAQRWAALAEDDAFLKYETKRAQGQLHDVLGQAHVALNEPNEAQAAYEKALELYAELENSPGLRATSHNNLGELHRYQGHYPEAITQYDAALEAMNLAHGREHPKVGAILNNRAAAKSDYGEFEAALEDMRHAVNLLERGREEQASFVALVRFNIGLLSTQLGRLEEARVMLEGARRSFEGMVLGPHGAYLAVADAGLAMLAMHEGNGDEAMRIIDGAYQTVRAEDVPPNPVSGSVIAERANILLNLGRPAESLRTSQEAIEMLEASLGAEALPTAIAYAIRGHGLSAAGQEKEARASYEQAQAIFDRIGNRLHPHLADVHRGLAVLDDRAGETGSAAEHRARVAEILEAHPGLFVTPEKVLRRTGMG